MNHNLYPGSLGELQIQPIAIIGIGCIFPPDAYNVEAFWKNILIGKSGITKILKDRWDYKLYFDEDKRAPDKTYCIYSAFIKDYKFPANNGFPSEQIRSLNRSQQMILDCILQACSQAKMDVKSFAENPKIGFCLGNMLGDEFFSRASVSYHKTEFFANLEKSSIYNRFSSKEKKHIRESFFNQVEVKFPSMQPGEYEKALNSSILKSVVKILGAQGKLWVIDAACASGLAVFDSAINNLLTQSLDCVVVTALCGNMLPPGNVAFSKVGGLARGDDIFPLDHRAVGLMPGEGAGCAVIKRLTDAVRDGNKILAVIRGKGNSTDGRGKGIYAPSSEGQLRAMKQSLDLAGLKPSEIDYIETHATSTSAGDVEELRGLKTLFQDENLPPNSVPIGSCKSLIGHTFSAAGMANLIKVIKAFDEEVLPPTYNFERFPPSASMENTAFYVNNQLKKWSKKDDFTPRRASLNAFGFGGVNSNMIIEEFLPAYHKKYFQYHNTTALDIKEVDIAVVGIGCLTGNARNCGEFLKENVNKLTFDRSYPPERWGPETSREYNKYIGEKFRINTIRSLDFSSTKFKIPPNVLKHLDRAQQIMLLTAQEALNNHGLSTSNSERTGMCVSSIFGLEASLTASLRIQKCEYLDILTKIEEIASLSSREREQLLAELSSAMSSYVPETAEDTLPGYMDNIVGARTAKFFNLRGGNIGVDNDSSSFGASLDIAIQSLWLKQYDTMVVGAVHANMMPEFLFLFNDLVKSHPQKQCPLCGLAYEKLIPAEGGVCFVLKRFEDVKEGEKIYGRIKNVGNEDRKVSTEFNQCCQLSHSNTRESLFYFGAHGGFTFLKALLALSESQFDILNHSSELIGVKDKVVSVINHSLLGKDYFITLESAASAPRREPFQRPQNKETLVVSREKPEYSSFYLGAHSEKELLSKINTCIVNIKNHETFLMTPEEVLNRPVRVSVVFRSENELLQKLSYLSQQLQEYAVKEIQSKWG